MTPTEMRRAAELLHKEGVMQRMTHSPDRAREFQDLAAKLRAMADAAERPYADDVIGRMCFCTTEPQKRLCHKRGLCMSAQADTTPLPPPPEAK